MRVKTEAKKKQITAAARTCFLKNSYGNCSMEQVAKEAGVSKQTLYSYYATKEALFMGAVMEVLGSAWPLDVQVGVTAGDASDFRAQLQDVASVFVGTLMQHDYLALLRIMIAEAPRHPMLAEKFRKHIPERAFRAFANLLHNAQSNGLVKISSPELAARMLLGGLITYILLEGLLASAEIIPADIHKKVDGFVDEFYDNISKAKSSIGGKNVS